MYEVMARRYRPAQFDEVVGQEHIAATLKNAITRGRVAHAYIFTGGHGCGKTTMARILAKALVCQNGPTPNPCGVCPICVDVAAGRDADILEIDGASNNGIEQIRQLREQAAYVPSRARFKIYIIDEVHMLSDGAFNALLKTLEEPPKHVKFILATTDPHKVPDTILSRCQRFDFRLVPPHVLVKFFRELAGREQAAIAPDALEAVAAFAEGSVRDGLVLLDQVLSFAEGEVTRRDVEAVRGVASAENVSGIYRDIAHGDVKGALAIVDETARRGTSVGDFLDQLIAFGRDLMLLAAGGGKEGIAAYGPAREILFALAEQTDLESALLYLDVFTQARTRVRTKALTNPLVALEMAVARLAGLGGVVPVAQLVSGLSELPQAAAPQAAVPQVTMPPAANPPVAPPHTFQAPVVSAAPVIPEAIPAEPTKPERTKPEPAKPVAAEPRQIEPEKPVIAVKPEIEAKPESATKTEIEPKADLSKAIPQDPDAVFYTEDEYWDDGHEEAGLAAKAASKTAPTAGRPVAAPEAKQDRKSKAKPEVDNAATALPPAEPVVEAPFDPDPPGAASAAASIPEPAPASGPAPAPEASPAPLAPPEALDATGPLSLEFVQGKWSEILDAMAEKHPADYRHLHHLSVGSVEPRGVVHFSGRATAIEPWEDSFRLERFRNVLREVLGRQVEVAFSVNKTKRAAGSGADGGTGGSGGKAPRRAGDGLAHLARKPAVETVRSLFDGVIVNYHSALEENADSGAAAETDDNAGAEDYTDHNTTL